MTDYDDDDGIWVDVNTRRPIEPEPSWFKTLTADQQRAYKKDQNVLAAYKEIWANNGRLNPLEGNQKIGMRELLEKDMKHTQMMRDAFSSDFPSLTKRVVSQSIRHPKEPIANLAGNVFQIESLQPGEIPVQLASSAVHAAIVGEGQEYPERQIDIAGDESAGWEKAGLSFKFTDELLRFFRADLLGASVQAGVNSLVRLREDKIATALQDDGQVVIDNTDTARKSTRGRSDDGNLNGTATVDDFWYVFKQAIQSGFTPNAIVAHPACWNIFTQDEGMRKAFDLENGNAPLFEAPKGADVGKSWHGEATLTVAQAPSTPSDIQSLTPGPNTLFPGISRIIPSAFMSGDFATNRFTIAMVDTHACGVVQQASSEPEIEDWRDAARDLEYTKLRWFWNISTLNGGEGIWQMRFISNDECHDFNSRVTLPMTGNAPPALGAQFQSGVV